MNRRLRGTYQNRQVSFQRLARDIAQSDAYPIHLWSRIISKQLFFTFIILYWLHTKYGTISGSHPRNSKPYFYTKRRIEICPMFDVIISKGQGNFETLNGCGLNIYYLFLCKCEWFVKRFGMERFKGVFINDRNCF